ncbi:hypothetical protein [uncultured Rubinisphaera sp.]|uniref:hypothetical protein n=1 Tax=uncultured Rubinisphaera sp. TaxID=1678686 RepID=UPI0030DB8E2E
MVTEILIYFIVVFIMIVLFWSVGSSPENGISFDKAYLKNHPPLSDKKFVVLCGEGVRPEIALKVRLIFAEISCMSYEHIYPDTRLIEDMKLD